MIPLKKLKNDLKTHNILSSRISTLAKQVKQEPNDSFSKFALALELIKIGDSNKALALFKNIVSDDPEYIGVYYHLGKLYEESEQNILAVQCYKKGINVATKLSNNHAKAELQGALVNLEFEMDDDI